ncbi:hypothetical protein ACR91O_27040, partial [Klebsiella pneumoniae]
GWIVTTGSSFLNTTLTPMNSATATRMEYYTETRGYYAKHVEFRMDKLTNLPSNTYLKIATIPAASAPKFQVCYVIPAYNDMNNHDKMISLWVSVAGEVFVGTTTSTVKSDSFSTAISWTKW